MDIETRSEQPYVGYRATVTWQTFNEIADKLPGLIGWLMERNIPIAGAPFLRYLVVGADEVEVEAGVPLEAPIPVEGDMFCKSLPAGRYATVTHRGHPDELFGVWEKLLAADVEWDVSGVAWGCRTESFLTNPMVEPDANKWETQLAVRML